MATTTPIKSKSATNAHPNLNAANSASIDIHKLITWFGHSSFSINASKRIYLDPWKLPDGLPKADIILVTHEHQDHFSMADIEKITGPHTHIIAHPGCVGIKGNVEYVKPGEKVALHDVVVDVVPAYNVTKFRPDGTHPHPKESQFNGYIIRIDGNTFYFAGDTDVIAEMKEFPKIDIAFLPVSGSYVMTSAEAAEAANIIKPRVAAIPMHHGTVIGTLADGDEFAQLVGQSAKLLKKHDG